MPTIKTPKLLLPEQYLKQATTEIKKAKKRIVFMALMITDNEITDDFIFELGNAAERGVDVQIAADIFTYGELGGHFVPFKFFTRQSRDTTSMVRELTSKRVKFNWLGRFSATPFSGRTHMKALVVDDIVFSFGGVNLYDESIANTDYMFICHDSRLADDIAHEFGQITKADKGNYAYRSHKFSYGENIIYD